MGMTDAIADMLTRIRNAQKSKLLHTKLPYSKIKCSILDTLIEEGFIASYEVINTNNKMDIEIKLKYSSSGKPAICEINKVSKPGKRIYSSIDKLKGYYNNMGIYILSTSKGLMSDRKAHQLGVGGEVICKVF